MALREVDHRAALVDANAHAQRHAPQPAHQLARMHGRGDGRIHACQVARGTRAARDFFGRQRAVGMNAAVLQPLHHGVERADLGLRGCGVERAVLPQLGVDALRAAEVGDVLHRIFRGPDEADGLGFAEQPAQREELGRPRQQAAAVAPARTGAAEIALDDGDVERRVALLRLDGGPQPGEAATDDADVGALCALQRGGEVAVVEEGLFDPEGAHVGRLSVSGYGCGVAACLDASTMCRA